MRRSWHTRLGDPPCEGSQPSMPFHGRGTNRADAGFPFLAGAGASRRPWVAGAGGTRLTALKARQ